MRFVVALLLSLAQAQAAEQIDPKIYARLFMNNKPMFDRMSAAVLEKLPTGGKILDLASGPGEPSITLATLDAKAQITCTDFQPSMNEKAKARARAANVTNVVFEVTSADDLSKWNDNSFDAVTMSFGLMFVPDKAKSLHEIYRVLKPGGFAYVSVWKTLTFQTFARKVLEEVAGKPVPEFAINPLRLKEDNAVEDLARAFALKVVADERMTYSFKMGTSKEAADGCTVLAGTILQQLEADGDTGATARFYETVEKHIQINGWRDGNEVAIPDNSPQLLTLRKPLQDEL
eukprot:TRINITY_DN105195_c0_g1_i1.p1 TRINITY_DN105195_c0_g1~~TRINITY_DN105195_c0_g1_i1.p1  ORF type:complete len:289 (+),score=51.50 TRINITY_DN105195_c0_g1_i1:51-917(+)